MVKKAKQEGPKQPQNHPDNWKHFHRHGTHLPQYPIGTTTLIGFIEQVRIGQKSEKHPPKVRQLRPRQVQDPPHNR